MSNAASNAQVPKPSEVPDTGKAQPEQTKKDSSKTAAYFELLENRRTYYALSDKSTLSNEQLTKLVGDAVKFTPTSFNMQQNRAIIVTGEKHRQMWDIIVDAQKANDPSIEDRAKTSFKPGYGTILFFGDKEIVDGWGAQMPHFHDLFKTWIETTSGMLQHVVWTALCAEGMGASLQHYLEFDPNALGKVRELLGFPESWVCPALMPFGVPAGPPGNPAHPKTFDDVEGKRLLTFYD